MSDYDASSHCYKCGEQWRSVLVCGCPKVTGPAYCLWVQREHGVSGLEDGWGELVARTEVVGDSEGIYTWEPEREEAK
jgi:hypothetical protein